MINLHRVTAIARKELFHLLRDWRSLYLALAIPVLLLILFGYALDQDIKNVKTLVLDWSRTPQSRAFIRMLESSPYFTVIAAENEGEIYRKIENGEVLAAVTIPADFAGQLNRPSVATVQAIADGSDANTARIALGYLQAIMMIYNRNLRMETAIQGETGGLEIQSRALFNPTMRSRLNIVPGIIVIVLVVLSSMLTSMTIAREWENGTMEMLISTPVQPAELMLGKVIPYYLIGLTDTAVAVLLGQVLFKVPLRGNPALIFLGAVIFLTGALFFGMLFSIRLKNQLMANQAALIASYMPTVLLSGFVIAIENMPLPIRILTHIVPGRYFIQILRGIYLKGAGMQILWIQFLFLLIYSLFMILLCRKNLKLRLE